MNKRTMTEFQVKADRELAALLANMGLKSDSQLVVGERENYIKARIPETTFDLYIYLDEAGIQGPGIDYRFEKPDYDGENELIAAFVGRVKSLAERAPNQAL
jgi:hypothetical protein